MSTIQGLGTQGVQNTSSISELSSSASVQMLFAQLQLELSKTNKEAALEQINEIRASQDSSKSYTSAINALRSLQSYDVEKYGEISTDPAKIQEELNSLNSAISDVSSKINSSTTGNVALSDSTMAYIDTRKEEGYFDFYRTSSKVTEYDTSKLSNRDNEHSQAELQDGLAALETRKAALENYLTVLNSTSSSGTSVLSEANISIKSNFTSDDIKTWISNLESSQEELGSDIQQKMVFVQDYMGQYNSYMQGASSAISEYSNVLSTIARGQ